VACASAACQGRRIQESRVTWALLVVSVALLLFAIAQTAIILKQEAGTHAQQIQASQYQNATGSPKQVFIENAQFSRPMPVFIGKPHDFGSK
jgi:hypothetical protein